jgi:hypothetical protein
VFSFVPTKKNVEEKCAERVNKYSKNKAKIEELSILILGVDSVSRSNMIRYMPETRKYLLQNMSGHPHYKEFYIHDESISSICNHIYRKEHFSCLLSKEVL